ncbi:hypothetical protein BST61_g214 [Cercospora zeina]
MKSFTIVTWLIAAVAAEWTCPQDHNTNYTVYGKQWNMQCDNSIQGTDIRRFFNRQDTLLSCAYACAEDPTCLGTSYISMTYTCILKSSIDAINMRPGVWSAYPVKDENCGDARDG